MSKCLKRKSLTQKNALTHRRGSSRHTGVYYTPQPQCVSRFVRPPPSAPDPGPPYLDHYPPYLQDRVVSSQYGTQPQQYPPMYPPHYDGRRVYPAPPREELFRESLIPIEIPPAAVPPYVPESRERYQQMEGYYPVAPHPTQIRPSYIRVCGVFSYYVDLT